MNAWFSFNGRKSSEFGIRVLRQPARIRPLERAVRTVVPGRTGSLVTTQGEDVYDDVLLEAECYLENTDRIGEINAWLKGSGKLELSGRPGGHYRARVNNQISFEKLLRVHPHVSFSVIFRCFPFWYRDNVSDITLTSSGEMITNPGNVSAEPLITVYGEGNISLMVGTTLVELTGISGSITLDCELKEAYTGSALMNSHMAGEFPALRPGANAVSWAGDVTKVVVRSKWRDF
jgi:phage-related protein